MAPPTKRKRPVLTVTVERETKERLEALARKIPGGTVSGVTRELLATTLPLMEQVVKLLEDAKLADGSFDEAVARDRLGAWIGTQVLTLYDTQGKLGAGGEDGT
jgi:hypothetical protein